jgi:hypothetical protein
MSGGFFIPASEIFLRGWWFAHHVVLACTELHNAFDTQNGLDMFWKEQRESWIEQERKAFFEALGYTTLFAIDQLRHDIEATSGWETDAFDLNLDYQLYIATGFDEIFDCRKLNAGRGIFFDVLMAYYDVNQYIINEDLDREVCEKWGAFDPKRGWIPERLYAYRLSRFATRVDADAAARYVAMYRPVGLSFYEPAFKQLSTERLEQELRQLRATWRKAP